MVNHVTGHNESIALTRADDVWERLHVGAKQAVPTAFRHGCAPQFAHIPIQYIREVCVWTYLGSAVYTSGQRDGGSPIAFEAGVTGPRWCRPCDAIDGLVAMVTVVWCHNEGMQNLQSIKGENLNFEVQFLSLKLNQEL